MKRWSSIILSVLMLLSASACGRAASENISFDETALNADASAVADALINGSFAEITAKFDKTMSKKLKEDALKSGWESGTEGLGAYIGRVSVSGEAKDGFYTVSVTDKYENNGLLLRVVYDGDGKISGLWFTYADVSEAQVTDDYQEIEITVQADPDFPLDAILTLPANADKAPVLILVHGSGTSDKNENIYGNKPFEDIAHGLAEKGIATLRYDKRYYVNPEKAPQISEITLRQETLDDVSAAIELMKQDGRVNPEQIYVLGHSLGGMLIPAIAAEHTELAGVISMAGSLRPLWEIVYDQNQEAIASLKATELSDSDKATLEAQSAQIEKDIKTLRGNFSTVPDTTVLMGIAAGYWKSLKEYGGMNFIDDVDIPMLIIQGDADFQVFADKDYTLWQNTVGDRENVTFKLYEGLNHLMMPTQGKRDISEYQVLSHVSQQVIDDIADFIK